VSLTSVSSNGLYNSNSWTHSSVSLLAFELVPNRKTGLVRSTRDEVWSFAQNQAGRFIDLRKISFDCSQYIRCFLCCFFYTWLATFKSFVLKIPRFSSSWTSVRLKFISIAMSGYCQCRRYMLSVCRSSVCDSDITTEVRIRRFSYKSSVVLTFSMSRPLKVILQTPTKCRLIHHGWVDVFRIFCRLFLKQLTETMLLLILHDWGGSNYGGVVFDFVSQVSFLVLYKHRRDYCFTLHPEDFIRR